MSLVYGLHLQTLLCVENNMKILSVSPFKIYLTLI